MERTASAVVIGNAVVWAAVLLGSAVALQGTAAFPTVAPVLGGGAAASVLVVGAGVRRLAEGE